MISSKRIYLIPFIGFLIIILLSSWFLYLPICNNKPISFINSVFVATSAVSTTGLTPVVLSEQFNFIGQLIIAILMEIGAFGFIVIISYIWSIKNKKISISDMILINDNISSDDFNLVKDHLIFIVTTMFKIQLIGTIFFAIKFIPSYGFFSGIWYSFFHSLSAFSNCGYDIIGPIGFRVFQDDVFIQIVTIILMFLGSLGILVIEDIRKNKTKKFNRLHLQSQIILIVSLFIIIIPAMIFIFLEKDISIINSLFTSVTTRSTGITVVNISNLCIISKYIIMILMLIGGGPASTSGGIKMLPIVIAFSTIVATLKGKDKTIIFNKRISDFVIKKAFTIITIFITILLIACAIFYSLNNIGPLNVIFESISAVTNTGLSISDYNNLNIIGESILITLMFIGRVGPLSMVLIFVKDSNKYKFIEFPEGKLII